VLLAHGAGADMTAPTLTTVTDALSAAGIASLRFRYPYRSAGKKAPDRPAVLLDATRSAVAELARRTKLPTVRLVLGGRSMGGRYCSLVAGDADDPVPCLGLVLLGYPLHAAGKPEKERRDHFPRLRVPVLFVSGTRDSLAAKPALTKAARTVKGPRTFHWIESGDHGFKPLKASGLTVDGVLADVADAVVGWVRDLP
jgi:predicted alpha/beta-hydrolase family hydrolase